MKVLKPFVRDGQRYKPGDPAPIGLDGPTVAHYKRHGMIGSADPVPKKASAPRATTSIAKRGIANLRISADSQPMDQQFGHASSSSDQTPIATGAGQIDHVPARLSESGASDGQHNVFDDPAG